MPQAGKTFSTASGYQCLRAGEDGRFGQYLYVCSQSIGVRWSSERASGGIARCAVLVLKSAIVEFMPTFPVVPGARHDNRV